MTEGYWFKSSKFSIEPGEDEDINPGIYGRQLAVWLKNRLEEKDYPVEEVFEEDWGRCLMCSRSPFMLWVGCANITDENNRLDSQLPAAEDVIWHCFATAEAPFWKGLFQRFDMEPAESKLHADLGNILREEPDITIVSEP